jgi:PAS domain S-box-containing protein
MRKTTWLPSLFFLVGAACILPLAAAINRAEAQRILGETTITRDQIALRIQSCIDARTRPVQALARHPWANVEQLQQEWRVRADTLYGMYDSILALNLIDADWRITIIHPEDQNSVALGFDLHEHPSPSVPASLALAEASPELVRSDILDLLQGGTGFALYQRISDSAGNTVGFADGVFRLDELMQTCLSAEALEGRFGFQLSEPGGAAFWSLPSSDTALIADYTSSTDFDVLGRPWTLQISPTQSWLDSQYNRFNQLWSALSLGLVAALALLLRSLMLKHSKLERSEHQFRLLVENQSDLVVEVNAVGEFSYVSPSFCRLFGKREEDFLGSHYRSCIHEDDRELVQQSLAKLARPPHTCYHEHRAATKDGWRWLAWSNTAVLDELGTISAITAVGRDVTELRQMEARASHAEKMSALGNLASGVSHDFNNILHVVLANIEFLMLDYPEDAGLQTELKSISQTLERAMSLVSRLASLSRQDPLRKDSIDLNEFVAEVLALLRRTLRPSISLHFEPAPQPLVVYGDKSQLEQVLLNLCFNARDSIVGTGNIRVRLQQSQAPQLRPEGQLAASAYACISVSDDGSGIPADVLPKIFEPFFTTKTPGNGTGLGLANCSSIIKQHLGDITVSSVPGAGSEFQLFLPLLEKRSSNPQRGAADARDAASALPEPHGSILVVDDDPEILRLTAALLRNAGFDTLIATNGEEALQQLALHRDDIVLVLMDVLMPVLGGLEAAERMHSERPELPVLLMSGYTPDTSKSGGQRLLRKPFTRETLLDTVATVLAESYSLNSAAT